MSSPDPSETLTPYQTQLLHRSRKRAVRQVHKAFALALAHTAQCKAKAYRALFRHQEHMIALAGDDRGALLNQELLQSEHDLAERLHAFECAVRDQGRVRAAFRDALGFADRSKPAYRGVMKGGRDLIQDARQTLYAPMLAWLASVIGEHDDAAD